MKRQMIKLLCCSVVVFMGFTGTGVVANATTVNHTTPIKMEVSHKTIQPDSYAKFIHKDFGIMINSKNNEAINFPVNTVVKVISYTSPYYTVKYNDKDYKVMSNNLTEVPNNTTDNIKVEPFLINAKDLGDSKDSSWALEHTSEVLASLRESNLSSVNSITSGTKCVTTKESRISENIVNSGVPLTSIPKGVQVTVSSVSGDYYLINYANGSYWIYKTDLEVAPKHLTAHKPEVKPVKKIEGRTSVKGTEGKTSVKADVEVNTGITNTAANASPYSYGSSEMVIPANTKVSIKGNAGDFYIVGYNGYEYYVLKSEITLSKNNSSTTSSSTGSTTSSSTGSTTSSSTSSTGNNTPSNNLTFNKVSLTGFSNAPYLSIPQVNNIYCTVCLSPYQEVNIVGENSEYYEISINDNLYYTAKSNIVAMNFSNSNKTVVLGNNEPVYNSPIANPNNIYETLSNAQLTVTGVSGDWYRVNYGGQNVYFKSSEINTNGIHLLNNTIQGIFYRGSEIFSQPNLNSTFTYSGPDQLVTIIGENSQFYEVMFSNGNIGYVHNYKVVTMDSLGIANVSWTPVNYNATIEENGEGINGQYYYTFNNGCILPQQEANTELPLHIIGQHGNWFKATLYGNVIYIQKDHLPATIGLAPGQNTVIGTGETAYALSIFSQPNFNSQIGSIAAGQTIYITGQSGLFYRIQWNNGKNTAYIDSNFIIPNMTTDSEPVVPNCNYTVYADPQSGNYIQLYSDKALTQYATSVQFDVPLVVLGTVGYDFQVEFQGNTYYVSQNEVNSNIIGRNPVGSMGYLPSSISGNSKTLQQLAASIANGYGNQYYMAQAIYLWVAEHITYNYTMMNDDENNVDMGWVDQGVMANNVYASGNSICTGFANLYAYLCNSVGIQCEVVNSSDHAWNYVYLEDGQNFRVDTTWAAGQRQYFMEDGMSASQADSLLLSPGTHYYSYDNGEYTDYGVTDYFDCPDGYNNPSHVYTGTRYDGFYAK